jgi:hypothetical protein
MSKPLDRLGSSRQRVIEALKIFASRGDERDSSEPTCPLCHHPVRLHSIHGRRWCARCAAFCSDFTTAKGNTP